MRRIITTVLLAAFAAPTVPMMAGCDKTLEHEKKTEVKDDGTTVQQEKKVTESPDGTVTKTQEKHVDHPDNP